MPTTRTILFAGGGTGGHLYPGIAVAQAFKTIDPDVRPVFLCTAKAIDRTILEPTGFEFIPQPIVPPVRTASGLLKFWRSWRETKDIVRTAVKEYRPAAVLGLGGYAAGVGVKYAAQKKVPAAIVNPDVIPGKANQYLMQYVNAVCCQFAETAEHVDAKHVEKLRVTGCPIRADMLPLPAKADAIGRLGLDPKLSTLVVTGASLGAKTVNEAVLTMLQGMTLHGWQILHLTGIDHVDAVRAGYRELQQPARIVDFTAAMADVWAVADIAISRAGASSCAELTACGVPSILFPYPYHKDLHQRANAKVLADAGAAILIDDVKDRRKNADALRPALESLLFDANKRNQMSAATTRLGRPDAASEVAKLLIELARAGR